MNMTPALKAHLMRFYDGTLLPDELTLALSRDPGWFASDTVARGERVRDLPLRPGGLPALRIEDQGRVFDLYDYLATNGVAGLLVLKRGQVAFETYQRGITPDTRWNSCSLAKSVAATLVGVALKEGAIDSLDDPVTKYADLGGVYREVSLRQMLRMCSGVQWNEDYGDPASERRRLLDVQARWQAGGIRNFMKALPARQPAGQAWAYNTGESYLLSAVMEGATGMRLADYLQSRLWSRLGMESDATWWSESPGGMTISGSGMNATLRDYARFGQFVLDGGKVDGERLLPDGWVAEAGAPYRIGDTDIPYGYMWWIPELKDPALQGTFQAEGIYGQFIHINPAQELVVVVLCSRGKPSYKKRVEINDDAFFAALARAF
ncbi:serine hydrolase domain-containing protein [Achromobacter kerstersii]|uniref:serine hydrolase domain-containing protein n=1 Tax=Achromobacter kerstersii TaxID=1353890 RepID=UPI003D015EC4